MISILLKEKSEFIRFSIIGLIGFIIEILILNLWMTITKGGPLIANTIATGIAIVFNWWANRNYNFTKTEKSKKLEITQFFIASLAGLIISLLLLWFVYYILVIQTLIAVNLTKVIGLIIGALIKYILYKHWVFKSR